MIGSLWLLAVIHLHKLMRHIKKARIYLYHLILQGTVLPYAFLYAFGSPLRHLVQKFALAGLIISLKLVISEYAKEREMMQNERGEI